MQKEILSNFRCWDTRVSRGHISFPYSTNHLLTQPDSDLYLSAKFIISQECPCQGRFSSQLHLAGLSPHFTPLISDLTLLWAHGTLSRVGTLCQISHRAGHAASVWVWGWSQLRHVTHGSTDKHITSHSVARHYFNSSMYWREGEKKNKTAFSALRGTQLVFC